MEKKLPKNWVETELGKVSEIIRGVSYNKNQALSFRNEDSAYILRGGNIQDGKIDFDTDDNVFVDKKLVNPIQFLKENDVVIVGSTGSKKLIGKAGVAIQDYDSVAFGAFLMLLRTKSINKKFHAYFFQTKFYRNLISELAGGVNINNIRKEYLENMAFPLPPLPEQERIVAKLDLLFAQHEKMKTALEKIPQLLKDFRQQILSQAVTGKLTEEISYVEVLEEIRNDRLNWYLSEVEISKSKKIKKPQKIVLEVDGDRDYLSKFLYKELDICFIEEIAAKKDNALKAGPFGSSLKKEFYVSEGYKIYGQEQVIKNDAFYGDYYIDEQKFNDLKSCEVFPNDLLISLVGTIGKVLILPNNSKKGIINPRLLKFSFHEFINPFFIKIYLESNIAKNFLKESSHGGTMDVLNLGILKTLPIPLPSLKEQTEIVSRVESLFTKIDAIELRYQKLKEKIDALPQTILHKAFKGELVPQLPTDGDAKDLLKEILALKKEGKKK